MNKPLRTKPIQVKINTTFAIGNTEAFSSQFLLLCRETSHAEGAYTCIMGKLLLLG